MKYSILAVVGVAIVFGACQSLNRYLGLKNDNFVEEWAESVIEDVTGLEGIDLTPDDLDYSEGCWFCD